MTAEKSHEFRDYMTFVGERLKAARNLRKMTQVEAAAAAGLPLSWGKRKKSNMHRTDNRSYQNLRRSL